VIKTDTTQHLIPFPRETSLEIRSTCTAVVQGRKSTVNIRVGWVKIRKEEKYKYNIIDTLDRF
jgi:hypothetical protein